MYSLITKKHRTITSAEDYKTFVSAALQYCFSCITPPDGHSRFMISSSETHRSEIKKAEALQRFLI